MFLTWYANNGPNTESIKLVPFIEEATRIIRPPNAEEYPYTPYEFADEEELRDYFSRANTIGSKGDLYYGAKEFIQKYIDQDKNILVILAAESIFTYFQDLFPITHYCEGIGNNDVGKSTIGFTFAYTGYRVIRGTSISGANYSRILGNVEPGQCVIIEDEADNISDDPEKVKILKAGYEFDARIPKTNMNSTNQETNWFSPYCYKIILAEKSMSEWKAKGLVDRTFSFKCRPGKVRYAIKNVVSDTIHKSLEFERLYTELLDFRRLILCYRLIHYDDELPEIKISVINRDEELSYPLLQLFYGTEAFEEIREALEYFISQRRERRSRSKAAAIYPILREFISNSNIIEYSLLWNKITSGTIKGVLNAHDSNRYDTVNYGSLYQNTFSKFICDNFDAILKHKEKGSVLIFDKDKFLMSFDEIYNHHADGEEIDIKIEVSVANETGNPDRPEGAEGSRDAFDNFEDGNNGQIEREIEVENVKNNQNKDSSAPLEPSVSSGPSANAFIKCTYQDCTFRNINQGTVDHHFRLTHLS